MKKMIKRVLAVALMIPQADGLGQLAQHQHAATRQQSLVW